MSKLNGPDTLNKEPVSTTLSEKEVRAVVRRIQALAETEPAKARGGEFGQKRETFNSKLFVTLGEERASMLIYHLGQPGRNGEPPLWTAQYSTESGHITVLNRNPKGLVPQQDFTKRIAELPPLTWNLALFPSIDAPSGYTQEEWVRARKMWYVIARVNNTSAIDGLPWKGQKHQDWVYNTLQRVQKEETLKQIEVGIVQPKPTIIPAKPWAPWPKEWMRSMAQYACSILADSFHIRIGAYRVQDAIQRQTQRVLAWEDHQNSNTYRSATVRKWLAAYVTK